MNQNKKVELTYKIKEDYSNIAGLVILKDGHTFYENYFNNFDKTNKCHIYSVTKSIMSLLIGIAIDQGYIQSVHQKVMDFFPNYKIKKGEEAIQNITLKDLLTMTAPYKYKFPPLTYLKYFINHNWTEFTLSQLGGKGRIGEFNYTPLVGPDLFSAILVKATGQSVFDFATQNLFSPLNITVKKNVILKNVKEQQKFNKSSHISGWVTDSTGLNAGGWGLTLSPCDMAKIGQLYLNEGLWKNQQIVSSKWIKESTKAHSYWKENDLSYGYLWWIIDNDEGACAAMGDGGNVIYFNKKRNLVISIASILIKTPKDRIILINSILEQI